MPHAKLFDRHDWRERLARHINLRTDRRVRRLEIGHTEGRALVRGQAPSYYVRQLAEKAAMDLVPTDALDLAIHVESATEGAAAMAVRPTAVSAGLSMA